MRSHALRLVAALACALLLAASAHAKGEPWVTKWFPFELRGGHILVPVKIAGVDARAMLDTGAAIHMLDREFAAQHGIASSFGNAVVIQAAHSRDRVPSTRGLPIELFGAPVKLSLVPVADVPFADLVIGTGVLSSFAMQIDYANSKIRFASHEAVNLKQMANVELRRSGSGLPAVRATVDGEDVWLMFDTGLTGPLVLTPRFAASRSWQEDAGTLSFDALGTVKAMKRYRVPLLQLGPFDLRGVVSEVPAEGRLPIVLTASGDGRLRLSGILGAEVLRHFLVTLDLKHMRLHLEQSQKLEAESWESSVSTDEPAPASEGAAGAPEVEPAPAD